MALDVLRLLAGRPLALDRAAIPALAERAAVLLAGADVSQAKARYAAAAGSRGVKTTPAGDVAIVPLSGPIMPDGFLCWLFDGTSPDGLVTALRQAVAAGVSTIIMPVDSPGGGVDLIQETAQEIRAISAQTPIIAIARCTAASAAYWLASQASEVIASPSSELGSIGVFACHISQEGLNAQLGIVPTYIVSAGSPFKVELNPDTSLSSEAAAYQQATVDAIYETFAADVARGRGVTAATVRKTFGGGRLMGAQAAVKAGLADRIDTLEHVVAKARSGRAGRQVRAERELLDMQLDVRERARGIPRHAPSAKGDRDALDLALAIRARV